MTIYGYARVSSRQQNLSAQINQLKEFGCERIYKEKVSGRKKDNREEFNKILEKVSDGDVIVVTKLDRFARSTKDALSTIEHLNNIGVGLVILNMGGDKVDTSTAIGKLMITVLSGIAEFEADMIRERQIEGIAEAKERGVYKGRPKKYTDKNQRLQHALELFAERDKNKKTVDQIAKITGVSRATIYRESKKADHK
ncbi:recombinase family protein [Bacillus sp. CH30_1T]|uniref:recombinase family protein n=1 Tax=Bacillus sp. CH30_1T TaxID=2604836 RepID=UPI0011EE76FE|nr:recombinase family protein [Bacillus sp. CH30_1T]KAA0565330.1 recombinase family protein [Bacillus sp. CH30_1T]